MSPTKQFGGWQNRVRRTWSDVVEELKSIAADVDTNYATLVPYAAELLPAVVIQPQEVRRELPTLAAAVDRAVMRASAERRDAQISTAVLEMLDVGNALECVGLSLAAATHDVFRDWLGRMKLTRDSPMMFEVWSAGFAALALDERATYRRVAARAGETRLSFTAGARFGFNVQAILGHMAAAVENNEALPAVTNAWDELLANYDTLFQGGSARLGTLLWAARVVHHRIGGAPVGEVAQRLQDDVRRVSGAVVSDSLEFPFLDPVAKDYRAESHLLGHGVQKLFIARRAQHPDERYLMCVDWYHDQDVDSIRVDLGYRIPGVFEIATIAQFDEHGVNAKRDAERRVHWSMLEKLPDGEWLPRVVARVPRSARMAVHMGIRAGTILKNAVDAGVLLIGVRPEYMWARTQSDGIEVTGLSARGQTFFKIVKPRSSFTHPLFERIYNAPEIIRREPADDRALTFTLALMVVEWATGKYPFPDSWVAGDNTSLITGAHAPLALPPKLETLVSRCLQPKVGTRPRLSELIDALRSVPTDEPARRL